MIIFAEDAAHKCLLRSLGFARKQILLMGSKGNVIKKLKARVGAIGLVDEDPGSNPPRELGTYHVVKTAENLQLMGRQGSSDQKLVVLCPRFEDWLMERAKLCSINPVMYHLPGTAKGLKNLPHYEERDGFRLLLTELNDRDKAMHLLREWLHGR